jgi:hypothetical protein
MMMHVPTNVQFTHVLYVDLIHAMWECLVSPSTKHRELLRHFCDLKMDTYFIAEMFLPSSNLQVLTTQNTSVGTCNVHIIC